MNTFDDIRRAYLFIFLFILLFINSFHFIPLRFLARECDKFLLIYSLVIRLHSRNNGRLIIAQLKSFNVRNEFPIESNPTTHTPVTIFVDLHFLSLPLPLSFAPLWFPCGSEGIASARPASRPQSHERQASIFSPARRTT